MREQCKSYFIEGLSRQTMNHLMNICSSKGIKYVSNRDSLMFDLSQEQQSEAMDEIQELLARSGETECIIKEI